MNTNRKLGISDKQTIMQVVTMLLIRDHFSQDLDCDSILNFVMLITYYIINIVNINKMKREAEDKVETLESQVKSDSAIKE